MLEFSESCLKLLSYCHYVVYYQNVSYITPYFLYVDKGFLERYPPTKVALVDLTKKLLL